MAAAALLSGGLLVGFAGRFLAPDDGRPSVNRFSHVVPVGQRIRNISRSVMAPSSDGRSFVLNTEDGLRLRTMDDLESRLLPGTEEGLWNPFYSPDGQWIACSQDSQLKRIAVSGGAPVVIGKLPGDPLWGASWEQDGTILFRHPDGVYRIPATGGSAELIVPAEGGGVSAPQLLPDGDSVLFSQLSDRAGDWDDARVVVYTLSTGRRTVVLEGGSDARYLPTGHLVYALGDGLFGIRFDADALTVVGGAVPLVQGVSRAESSSGANYGVADDGTPVYLAGSGTESRTLVWVDRDGRETAIEMPPRAYQYPRLSPDGTRVALDVRDEQNDIWVWTFAQETLTRLTFDAGARPDACLVARWPADRVRERSLPSGNADVAPCRRNRNCTTAE